MATWLKVTLNILLAAALIACSVAITIYTDIFDKDKKYTYRDLEEAYETGYSKASATVADLQAKINKLEQEKQSIIIDYENKLNEKDTQHKTEIAELNAEIERLKAELEIYSNQELDFVYVTFYVDNEVYKTVSVRENGCILIDIEEPTKEGYSFKGWLNGSDLVDLKELSFTENTDLYAEFVKEYLITFYLQDYNDIENQTLYSTQVVTSVDELLIGRPTLEGYYFIGWYVDGEQLDLSILKLTDNLKIIGYWDLYMFEGTYSTSTNVAISNYNYDIDIIFTVESGVLKDIEFSGTCTNHSRNCVYNLAVQDISSDKRTVTLRYYIDNDWYVTTTIELFVYDNSVRMSTNTKF